MTINYPTRSGKIRIFQLSMLCYSQNQAQTQHLSFANKQGLCHSDAVSNTHTGLEVAGCFLVELVICPGPLALGPTLPPLGVLLSQPARPAVLPWY